MNITIIFRNGNKTTIKHAKNAFYDHAKDELVIITEKSCVEYYGENIARYIAEMEEK